MGHGINDLLRFAIEHRIFADERLGSGIIAIALQPHDFSDQVADGEVDSVLVDPEEVVVCTFFNSNLVPSAAPASISGRTVDSFGNGIGNTRVTVTNAETGETFYALTNPFGYYTIEGPTVGSFYIMTVSNKRYTFADNTRTFTLNEDLAGIDFVANP